MTARATAARTAQVRRLQAMAELVVATLGAVLLARADEQATLLRQCATNADGIAEELAQMSGGAA